MANLTAKFQIIDEMSAKLDAVANSGENMVNRLEEIGSCANDAFSDVQSGSVQAAQSIDGVASAASSASQQGTQMGADVAEAAKKAAHETERLSDETEEFGNKTEEAGEKGSNAVEGIAQALSAAGITAIIKEAAEASYELAAGFSEAEKTITGSTGATGEELDRLMDSASRVFSSSNAEDLNQVAAAMSSVEITTGLIGDDLERATSYALDLEDILGYDVSQSAKTASSLMKNFGISAENAYEIIAYGAQNGADKNGDLLDVLNEYSAHYAALGLSADEFLSSLIEGAEAGVFSVDKVGDAVKEFNIRAKDGSETSAQAFQMLGMDSDEMFAKFAAGGDAASEAFFDVVSALDGMDDPMEKNTAAVALFGTMYEDLEANILPVLGNIEGGTADMHEALDTVVNDAKSLDDRWTEAGNSLSVAFTSEISPAISGISETFAELVHNAGDYLQQHPEVTKAITAIGVGIGVATAAIAGYVAITKVAIPLIHSFGVALNSALGPIGWIAIGITAVTAAVTAFSAMSEEAEDETLKMTVATRAQYTELQELEAAYQNACDTYGETSEEASRLRYQVDDLSVAFEQNQQTIDEFIAECHAVSEAHAEMVERFEENEKSLENNELGTFALIQKLSDLADGTYQTIDSQNAMKAIIDELNDSIEGLNLTYTDVITNQEGVIQNIEEMARAEAERARQQTKYDEFVELIQKQATESEKLAAFKEELAAAQEEFNILQEEYNAAHAEMVAQITDESSIDPAFYDIANAYGNAGNKLNTLNAEIKATQADLDHTEALMDEIRTSWGLVSDETSKNEQASISWQFASEQAFESVQTEMEELIQEYGEVYEAALSSLEGQFGLFDEASTKSEEYTEATVKNAQEALDSQLAYWESYSDNLAFLQGLSAEQLGTTEENYAALISMIQDGSAESAGLAASMVAQIRDGNEEAVGELAETAATVAQEREEIASSTAEWLLDFDGKMGELTKIMEETVDSLQLDDEASEAAKATIDAYADAILAQKESAVDAATQVAEAVTAAFRSTYLSKIIDTYSTYAPSVTGPAAESFKELTGPRIPGYAVGTTDAEDVFMAGEEGPELIVGHEGATVFPTTETDRIVNAVNAVDNVTSVTFVDELLTAMERYNNRNIAGYILTSPERAKEGSENRNNPQDKTIRLEIAGTGSLNVGTSASKEDVVELMYANLKPVLMNIVQEEIFEEGDHSYDF